MSGRIKSQRVACQFCNRINRTKTLRMELVCSVCGKYAKYRDQKMKLVKLFDRSNSVCIEVYQTVRQEKPCTVCTKLTPTNKTCHEMFEKINRESTEAVLA